MNGADSLVDTLVAAGVEACFANPGTSEMHFVAALDRAAGLRAVLCLFEGVATGAADGYGRMAGKPAATLLHLGPGLANGLANLHNARKAGTPVVNIVGDHALSHQRYDAPLSSDLAGVARPMSHWVHACQSSLTVAADAARAVEAARRPPGQIATLLLPADCAWELALGPAAPLPVPQPATPDPAAIAATAAALAKGEKAALLLRGAVLQTRGLEAAGRIRAKTGARLLCDTFAPRLTRGAGVPTVEKIPYFAEQIVEFLGGLEALALVGGAPPVSFFAYPGKPSWCLPPGCALIPLAHPHDDGVAALEALAEAVGAPAEPAGRAAPSRPDRPTGALTQWAAGAALARCLAEGAIVVDEAATSGLGPYQQTQGAPPHDVLALTGGSIGYGLPCAVGAAVACPGRKVVCLHGDGGALYTLQALWTMARERLDVTTVIFANRSYAILNIELGRVGAVNPGPKALSMLDIGNPSLDWVRLAEGMGVPASRADTAEAFEDQLADALAQPGPRLIEARV